MILIALGSNLPSRAGSSAETLRAALHELAQRGVVPAQVSAFYATPAWPDPADPSYVNAVARVDTSLAPDALMTALHAVERMFGRIRSARNAPRTLDLDLLDYNGRIEGGPPVLPHPRIEARGFVLVPLAEIAPLWRHPVSGRDVRALIDALPEADRQIERLG
ncbi:MAG: 2-amino-4-hydroxy-6-hydroxymethyldihydropteridine diphosphokinase [Rhizomicrobium sp.]